MDNGRVRLNMDGPIARKVFSVPGKIVLPWPKESLDARAHNRQEKK